MAYSADYKGSLVDTFMVGGNQYFHTIHCNTDDRVECTDEDGHVVLTFTANSYVYVGKWKDFQLGYLSMNRDHTWKFKFGTEGKIMHSEHTDLLKFEVEISKAYIKGEL